MKIHFIAIGGSAMHNLALALHHKGYEITGSDDQIFEPSKSRLDKYGLLPKTEGWHPEQINNEMDAIILGMHARPDNPELKRALELGIPLYSYPEFLYHQTKDKTRIVIAGSHGKTTITSMVMHVFKYIGRSFDYMVGSQLEGFETMVGLSNNSEWAIFEGDEYLSSPIDSEPKFLHYHPHIASISGIQWDHINVFTTRENYNFQFEKLLNHIEPNGTIIYFSDDEVLKSLVEGNNRSDLNKIAYSTPDFKLEEQQYHINYNKNYHPVNVIGDHNLQNIMAAWGICQSAGIDETKFFEAIQSFRGAARRLEKVYSNNSTTIYYDFAHAPSKVKATVTAIKKQFPTKSLFAFLELHTFSSLNKNFFPEYCGSMDGADIPWVFFSPETVKHKKLEPIDPEEIKNSFKNSSLKVFTDMNSVKSEMQNISFSNSIVLVMTSGNLDGIGIKEFINWVSDKIN